MKEYKSILKELIKDKETWSELKPELSKYNVHSTDTSDKDTRAGKIFEVFAKLYFLVSPTEKDNFKNVWLFDETPLDVRNKLNIGNQDYGVDLILQDFEDHFFVVQCKYKNDESSKLNWSADKIANLFAFCPNANGYIVFSNAIDIDNVSKTRYENFTFYGVSNLNEIDKETFNSINIFLIQNQLKERKLFKPLPHQETAIDECVKWFTEGEESRGQLILPCGAGKTLTALWINEKLQNKNTLVLVPSLALLRQIKNDWAKQRKLNYQYLCVCSENDIDKDSIDNLVTHTYEIDTRVTTDLKHVKSFLLKPFERKVIFSTYHSLPVIANAIKELNSEFEFDFTFCDEAHKTAGIGNNKFSLVHNNNIIPSKYRLYATATPRIVKESLKKKLGEDLKYAYDMNDPNTFGYEFYRMTFKDAIEKEILVDYKIIAIGVNNDEIKEYIEKRKFIDKNISIDELANNYALEYVMKKYNANHGLTFHSRVKLAIEFAQRQGKLFPDTKTFSVSGEQSTNYRNLVLEEFKNSEKAIISNARCLTEGVDVPTIDLVYFCDPKNSKIDIVQAVGRALRKKDGKKIGLIVVPIFHSKKDKIENSISSSSFQNLLQVIRSLCDQDERLQDEINSIAFGKGRRKTNKIEIGFSNFIDDQEKIILQGFEEILKHTIFDQIIEKTSNNWDLWFLELEEFLKKNDNYPNKHDNKELYNWVASQRNRKNKGLLKNDEIRKLNSINFAWDIILQKWERMFSFFKVYAESNEHPPFQGFDDNELVKWYKYQQNCIKEDKIISKDQKIRFLTIDEKFKGPANRKKWLPYYDELINFRKLHPNKWPQHEKGNSKSKQSQLNRFCRSLRKRFRNGDLENYWFDKMSSIDFNFDGHSDNWQSKYEEYFSLVEQKKSISVLKIGEKAYAWIMLQIKNDKNGKLNTNQSKQLENINKYFNNINSWDETFNQVKLWIKNNNGKIPNRKSQKDFHSWLTSQRNVFKNGNLTKLQIKNLASIGYEIIPKGNEKVEKRWNEMFENVKTFKLKNNIWPKFGAKDLEGQMYNWCQAQRQAQAGTHSGGKRKPLQKWQIEKLESIDFYWAKSNLNDEQWEQNFNDFKKCVDSAGNISLSSMINGEINTLYRWFSNQRIAFSKNKITKNKLDRFLEIGIDLNVFENENNKNGFTKWANRTKEISQFIIENGHYPKVGKDKIQNNLYHSLSRTKKSFLNNDLTESQLELLKELNIDLL